MKNMEKRNDFILIAGILVLALAAYLGITYYQGANTENAVAVVTVDDVEYGRFPLDEDRIERIELSDGSYNILEIKDGKADVTEASCPDGICVNHRAVSKQNQSIVCLPNKVVVVIENGAEADVDTVTN